MRLLHLLTADQISGREWSGQGADWLHRRADHEWLAVAHATRQSTGTIRAVYPRASRSAPFNHVMNL